MANISWAHPLSQHFPGQAFVAFSRQKKGEATHNVCGPSKVKYLTDLEKLCGTAHNKQIFQSPENSFIRSIPIWSVSADSVSFRAISFRCQPDSASARMRMLGAKETGSNEQKETAVVGKTQWMAVKTKYTSWRLIALRETEEQPLKSESQERTLEVRKNQNKK